MANNMQNTGKSINEQIWGEGGSGYEGYKAQVEKEKEQQAQTGNAANGYNKQDLQNAINQANQNGANITGSTDQYSQYDSRREVASGSSGADEDHLSDAAYQYVQYAKQMYAASDSPEDKAYWHNEAEKTRAAYGYSAGTDGSMYIPVGHFDDVNGQSSGNGSGDYMFPDEQAAASDPTSNLKGLLDAWQDAAIKQQNGQIDYAVAKAVADLERALADAQPQFKEQAESVDRSARQAMDNSALYAEMRGDKGGIGQEQYNSIQNTQAQNHLTVQQAQTKLATDTQRQIADLRAQGEFEKADAALQITQQYLQQLIGLEQWAAEYNLSVDQFNESVRQWEAEYNMAMQQLQISQNQWQQEFDFANQQYQDSLKQWEQEFALEQYLAQLKNTSSGTGNPKSEWEAMSSADIYQSLYDLGYTNRSESSISAFLQSQGLSSSLADKYAEAYVTEQYRLLSEAGDGWSGGYDTNQNTNGVKASEWGYVRNNIQQNLMRRDFSAVSRYLDMVAGGFSPAQWLEIQALLDEYGFVDPN